MTTLYIVRGLPGSGKSTFAKTEFPNVFHCEADMWFINVHGEYDFKPTQLALAHNWCYNTVLHTLEQGYDVIVTNTFTTMWEMKKYIALVDIVPDLKIEVIECCGDYGNVHNVPQDKLEQMKARWEDLPSDFPYPITRLGLGLE